MTKPTERLAASAVEGKSRALQALMTKAAESLRSLRFHREELQVEPTAEMVENLQNAAVREVELGRLDRESLQLALVRQAVEAVRQGKYGECTDCGEQIPVRRLEALPWAIRCVQCQEGLEVRMEPEGNGARWTLQPSEA